MHIFAGGSSHSPLPPRIAVRNTRSMDHETSPQRCILRFWPALPLVCIFFFCLEGGISQLFSSYLLEQPDWAQQQLCLFRFLHLARLFCEAFHSSFKFDAYPHRFQVRAQLIEVALTPELKSPNCFRHPYHPCRAPMNVL